MLKNYGSLKWYFYSVWYTLTDIKIMVHIVYIVQFMQMKYQ